MNNEYAENQRFYQIIQESLDIIAKTKNSSTLISRAVVMVRMYEMMLGSDVLAKQYFGMSHYEYGEQVIKPAYNGAIDQYSIETTEKMMTALEKRKTQKAKINVIENTIERINKDTEDYSELKEYRENLIEKINQIKSTL